MRGHIVWRITEIVMLIQYPAWDLTEHNKGSFSLTSISFSVLILLSLLLNKNISLWGRDEMESLNLKVL